MKNIYYFLAFLLLAGLYSCTKGQSPAAVKSSGSTTSQTTTTTQTTTATKQTYVYVLGTEGGVSKYWKNGVPVVLSTSTNVHLSAIAVSGTDVYAVGYQTTTNGKQAIYYKNGTLVILAGSQNYSAATSISISDGNVYIGGIEGGTPTGGPAQYWKNGSPVALSPAPSGYATFYDYVSVFASGSNLYAAAAGARVQEKNRQLSFLIVSNYWNPAGSIFGLSPGTNPSYVNSIFVSGTDVYLAGSYKNIATYWKNSTPVSLTDTIPYAVYTGIAVSGTNIYIAGSKGGIAKYWKNGTPVNLTNGSLTAAANAITLSGTDIYIAGNDGPTAKYWKNGTAVSLTNGSSTAVANSIFVITE